MRAIMDAYTYTHCIFIIIDSPLMNLAFDYM